MYTFLIELPEFEVECYIVSSVCCVTDFSAACISLPHSEEYSAVSFQHFLHHLQTECAVLWTVELCLCKALLSRL